jgi:integrase
MRFADEIRLAPDEFRLLRDFINRHCGIVLSPEQRPAIERRLRERLSIHGLHSFGEYYQLLRSPDRGRDELIRLVQQYLGHRKLETTMLYLHLTTRGQEWALDIIDQLMQ